MKEGQREFIGYVLHERAYNRSRDVYNKKIKGREPKDFIGGQFYTEEAVGGIENRMSQYHTVFAQELDRLNPEQKAKLEMAHKLADCLEGVILNTKTWFGPTSNIYPTTRWDDVMNGVDLVAERMNGDIANHHGFALDITYAGYNTILKKINRIVDHLKKGQLGKVDFFRSNDGRFKGQLEQIPLVVIGADGGTMKELVNLFAENEDQKIEDHPVQFQIVDQVLMQCDFFIEIGKNVEDKEVSEKIINAYEGLKKDFELIKKIKQMLNDTTGSRFRDVFHENLTDILGALKNPEVLEEENTL